MYQKRMLGYYPPVIQSILDFQAIVDSESPEIESLGEEVSKVSLDAYLTTMSEERITQWEKRLGVRPSANATLEDRRSVILARVRGQGKLNTALIDKIVNAFTGNTAKSKVVNGVLYIEIRLPANNRNYDLDSLKNELLKKVPAHLGVQITLEYSTWGNVKNLHPTWSDVLESHGTWENVLYERHGEAGRLDITPISDFILV